MLNGFLEVASVNTFVCSICLEVFSEPVSTPCGHNFCKSCITEFWSRSEAKQCPLCNESFVSAPELRVNTEFRDILQLFKETSAAEGRGLPVHAGDVPCDLCCGAKSKAVKSCLGCLVSYCDAHLEPHHRVPALKWHTLVSPVESLEDRACRTHNKLKEFFCRTDQSCVCAACSRDDHAMHEVVSLEEELKQRKSQLLLMKVRVDQTLEEKSITAERIQNSIKQRRQKVKKVKAETIRSFAALVALIEAKKMKLIEFLEEKQKATEQEAEMVVGQLQMEISENQRISTQLEDLLKTEDDFRLLQDLPSIAAPTESKSFRPKTQTVLHENTVKMAVAQTEEVLSQQVEIMIREASLTELQEPGDPETDVVFHDELETIQQECMTTVSLDPSTAHPSLIVSEDRKRVMDGGSRRNVSDNSSRFDCLHYVLGNEGFSSGRFYFEVSVKGQTTWEVGVARDTINRKGVNLSLSPEHGCWTLGSYWGRCQVNSNPPVVLPGAPEKLGVFVDCDQRVVSFYDVDTRTLIYSFTKCTLSLDSPEDAGKRATSGRSLVERRIYVGTVTTNRIYPIFRPGSEETEAALWICPVRSSKRRK
ncbi:E3 ubiquitin-protein ligase TRIM39 isoform X2 [Nothobranchius furzeri]|uniref:E3 ubiquitin-protein ligase TRIM39-like n=1 Tax=Nothobranchius furzeri TaxID=105023 RepID=A0A1A8U891_NOTFU|nr:E3 ubiquitin-protein ligase TRIM39 [Nothobranchius furzeri]XP_054596369.1 E3 ubiquitin-protein ligase TRIM39 [Nothobranchius furzeri]